MKKHWKKSLTFGLSVLMLLNPPLSAVFSGNGFFCLSYAAERPASVTATTLNVRSGPGTGNSLVGQVVYGAAVTVLGQVSAADGTLWYQIRFTGNNGVTATGYVMGTYIAFSSNNYNYSNDMNFEAYLDSQGFPESYRPGLRALHARYPQWIFTAFDTGLDWNEVIQNESQVGRNLVDTNSVSSWKSTATGAYDWNSSTWPGFDGSRWVAASDGIIRYYMDPRNFLNETYIFQFLLQNYDASIHTREGLASMVKGTFLEGYGTVGGVYNGNTGSAAGSTTGNTALTGPGSSGTGTTASGTSAGGTGTGNGLGESAAGSGNTSDTGNTSAAGSSSTENGWGPGYSSGAASGGQNSAGTASGTQKNPNKASEENGNFSNVWKGVAPGANISKNTEEGLSISRNRAEQVTATVVRIGPGDNPATGENGGGGVTAPGSASQGAGTGALSQTSPETEDLTSSGTAGNTGFSGTSAPYVDILLQAGVQSGVSPYVLAAMILQEQGRDGKSDSISGTSGYYNFYNFEAYASNGMTPVQRGLWYASQSGSYLRPWNSADKAIIGGAIQYGQNYMEAGQNTFYLKKFNVQGSNLYKHQYMTNVEGAASEGAKMAEAYSEAMRGTAMCFSIPVYRNMPAEASAKPVGDGSPNNKLQSLTVNGYTLTPSFNRDTEVYDVTVGSSDTSITVQAVSADAAASISGTGTIMLYSAVTEVKVQVTAQNGTVREYLLRITKENTGAGTAPTAGTEPTAGNGTAAPGAGTTSTGNGTAPAAGTAPSAGNGTLPASGNIPAAGSSHTGPGGSNVTIVY